MQFNSYEFILILLPITLLLFFTIGRINVKCQKSVLCIVGLVFFGIGGVKGLAILLFSMAMNILLCEVMLETEKLRKPFLIFTIAFNVMMLFAFKYSNFAISNINLLLGKNIRTFNLTLPLGISFFTFQQIAYAVELYRGKIDDLDLLDYATYVLYFPKLVMGPIVDPIKLIDDLNNPKNTVINFDAIVSGLKMFCFGLFKKMVLADTFAVAVSWGLGNMPMATSLDLIIVMLSYTFQLYFDFSGYTDMATGVSRMLNIDLPMNFNSPYKALSVRDFWDRWHMSLTQFLTKYIYYPLGGSRKGNIRTYINVMIVFTVSGIWHGANWTFILWGVFYGMLSVLDRIAEPYWTKLPKPIRWAITFMIVNVLWLLFTSPDLSSWIYMLRTIVIGGTFTISPALTNCFRAVETPVFEDLLKLNANPFFVSGTAWMLLLLGVSAVICLLLKNNKEIEKNNSFLFLVPAALAFIWSFLYLGSESVFIYNYF